MSARGWGLRIWPQCKNLNTLGRDPLGEAMYQISKALDYCFQTRRFLKFSPIWVYVNFVLGFNDTSTIVGHSVSSPREREKKLTCYKDNRPCPNVSQYQLDAPVMYDT